MPWNTDIWDLINKAGTSAMRDERGGTRVVDSAHFKPLAEKSHSRVNDMTANELLKRFRQNAGTMKTVVRTLSDVAKKSANLVPMIINNWKTDRPLTAAARDSIMNRSFMTGVPGQDPATNNVVTANIWLSPREAQSIFSQKGLPEIVIKKKSQSILLNGVAVKNPRLTPTQLDAVQENAMRLGLPNKLADSTRDSLVYGGALLFPMFKSDTPLSMSMSVQQLAKWGVVKKHCIDRLVSLDRWNTVHIPNWNPTAEDFLEPKRYYVPFLGCDVSGSRCSRIVTAPQAGYWGTLMTMGWGISDIPGWIESVYNYYAVMAAIPTMIAQMSILARTFNVDGILATEGSNVLNDIDLANTIKAREASVLNPISLDVLGSIQAIQRDFKEVPNLVRLIRQHFAAQTGIPEELFFSSERGAFSTGDTTEGALEKQWESIKYMHRDVAAQMKNIAMLVIIDTLGLDRDVLRALPYTYMEFDNPALANITDKAKVADFLTGSYFNLVSGQMPMEQAVGIIAEIGGTDFPVGAKLMEELRERQAKIDARDDEEHELNMELLEAQIEQAKSSAVMGGPGAPSGGAAGRKKGYTPLEQRRHEKTRGTGARMEGMQKAAAKKTG
jgi:hypothetical protein